jgi:coproporphyrinogen III oxidase
MAFRQQATFGFLSSGLSLIVWQETPVVPVGHMVCASVLTSSQETVLESEVRVDLEATAQSD